MKAFNPDEPEVNGQENLPKSANKDSRPKKGRWRSRFIHYLRLSGALEYSAAKAGVTSRAVRAYRERNPKFDAKVEMVLSAQKSAVDACILHRGKRGSDRLLLAWARAHMPELYGKRVGGRQINVPVTVIQFETAEPRRGPEAVTSQDVRDMPALPVAQATEVVIE